MNLVERGCLWVEESWYLEIDAKQGMAVEARLASAYTLAALDGRRAVQHSSLASGCHSSAVQEPKTAVGSTAGMLDILGLVSVAGRTAVDVDADTGYGCSRRDIAHVGTATERAEL